MPSYLCCSALQLPSGCGYTCWLHGCFLRHGHHLFDWHCGSDTISNHFSASCWCQQGLFIACLSCERAVSHQAVDGPRRGPHRLGIDQLHLLTASLAKYDLPPHNFGKYTQPFQDAVARRQTTVTEAALLLPKQEQESHHPEVKRGSA